MPETSDYLRFEAQAVIKDLKPYRIDTERPCVELTLLVREKLHFWVWAFKERALKVLERFNPGNVVHVTGIIVRRKDREGRWRTLFYLADIELVEGLPENDYHVMSMAADLADADDLEF